LENKEQEERDIRCLTFLLREIYEKEKEKSGEQFAAKCLPF
jgi:hypothetical protein